MLAPLNTVRLERGLRRPVAALARRAHCYNLGLKILAPLLAQNPTPGEKAEYAALLHGLGSTAEALKILEQVDSGAAPEAWLYLAQCHFSQWNFPAAVAALENFLAHPSIPDHARFLGELSLFSALVSSEEYERANELKARIEGSIPNDLRLQALFAQARCELAICENDFLEAERQIRLAERALLDAAEHFRTRQWRAVITLNTSGDSEPLQRVRGEAVLAGEWETVRGCDFQMMKFAGTQDLYHRLFAGSPIQPFREALRRATHNRFKAPLEAVLGEGEAWFDLTTGEINGRDVFSRKKTLHRVLVALCRDIYRPLKVGGLFATVFPDEPFDVFTSPDRLHQLLFRLRAVLRANGSPLEIVEENQSYRAVVQSGWKVTLEVSSGGIEPSHIARLRHLFGHEFFTPRKARESLNLTPSALRRVIRSALDAKLLIQDGRGPSCRYRIAG